MVIVLCILDYHGPIASTCKLHDTTILGEKWCEMKEKSVSGD